jgi:hypothetical protein
MSETLQTVLALAIVAATAAALIWRALARRKKGGCAGNCGCHPNLLKKR